MIAICVAAALTYSFPVGMRTEYELTVEFDGYLPVLGRTQNKAKVEMTLSVEGRAPGESGEVRATYDVAAMRASLGGVGLPFTAENIRSYFPKANISVSPSGLVLKSDAPATSLPIRLPGLDSRRLPEITFLPLEFAGDGVEIGKPWTFRRKFGDGEIEFTATPTSVDENMASFEVKLASESTVFEDASGGTVKLEKDAAARVETKLAGEGKVLFDRKLGAVSRWNAAYTASSVVTNLKSKERSDRVLKTKVEVVRRS